MKRIIMLLTVAALLVASLTITATGAFADPLPNNCTKTQGTVTCTESGKNPKFTSTTTQKGSLQSSHEPATTCTKPCPPGQFK
jgi:hypothetical protein